MAKNEIKQGTNLENKKVAPPPPPLPTKEQLKIRDTKADIMEQIAKNRKNNPNKTVEQGKHIRKTSSFGDELVQRLAKRKKIEDGPEATYGKVQEEKPQEPKKVEKPKVEIKKDANGVPLPPPPPPVLGKATTTFTRQQPKAAPKPTIKIAKPAITLDAINGIRAKLKSATERTTPSSPQSANKDFERPVLKSNVSRSMPVSPAVNNQVASIKLRKTVSVKEEINEVPEFVKKAASIRSRRNSAEKQEPSRKNSINKDGKDMQM